MGPLHEEHCIACGVRFGIDEQFQVSLKRSKATYYCTNGHGMSYIKSEAEDLREELGKKDARIENLRQALVDRGVLYDKLVRSMRAMRGALTRAKREVK